MAVGNGKKDSIPGHNKAELYSHSTSSWKTKASYPFYTVIRAYEILAHSNSFFLFSGLYTDGQTYIIAKFNPASDQWTEIGNLQQSRRGFSIIAMGTKFIVMGGYSGDMHTEVCELKNEFIKCTSRKPTLKDFVYYPALMTVSSDYADNC